MFARLNLSLQQRCFDARKIIRLIESSDVLNRDPFNANEIFTAEICRQITATEGSAEAHHHLCSFWFIGPRLPVESYFIIASVAVTCDSGLTGIIMNELEKVRTDPANRENPEIAILEQLFQKYKRFSLHFPEAGSHLKEPSFGGIFPDNVAGFFERLEIEEKLQTAVKDLIELKQNGSLIVWGTGGIGKTTIVNHVVNPKSKFWIDASLCPVQFDAVLWLNVCEMSIGTLYHEQEFLAALEKLFRSVNLLPPNTNGNTPPDFATFQSVMNAKKRRILLILDDVFCAGVLRSVSRMSNVNDSIYCIAVTRNYSRAHFHGFPAESLEIETLSQQSLCDILGNHFRLKTDKGLDDEQILTLAKTSLGLPLIASVIESHFRHLTAKTSIQKKYIELVSTLEAISQTEIPTDDKTSQHAQMTVSKLLTFSPEFQQPDFCSTYYTFLIFNAGEAVETVDLAIMLGLDDYDEVAEHCRTAVEASLLRRCSDNGQQSFVVHDLLHKATVERAQNDLNVKGLSKIRSKLLNDIFVKQPETLNSALSKERVKLLQLFIQNITTDILPQAYLLNDPCPMETLLQFAFEKRWLVNGGRPTERPLSVEIFCKLTDLAAIDSFFEKTILIFSSKNLYGMIPLGKGQRWYDNIVMASVRLSCINLLKLLLQNDRISQQLAEFVDKDGNNALMLAALAGNLDIVSLLLSEHRFDVNAKNRRGETALMRCSASLNEKHRLAIAKLICSQPNCQVNLTNNVGNTALMEACCLNRRDIALYLTDEQGADLDICNRMNQANALELVLSRYGWFDICRDLVERGASTNAASKAYLEIMKRMEEYPDLRPKIAPIVEFALANHKPELISPHTMPAASLEQWRDELLLALKSNDAPYFERNDLWRCHINDVCDLATGDTPLIVASQFGFEKIVKILLDNGANVEARNCDDDTALLLACRKGHLEAAKILVLEGAARIDVQNANGWSPLIWTAREGFSELTEFLLSQPSGLASIDFQNDNEHTGLIFASALNRFRDVKALVVHGASVDLQNVYGHTALHVAVKNRFPNVARWLLEEAAPSIDVQNVRGWTALMYACQNGDLQSAKMLIDHNASVHVLPFETSETLLGAARKSENTILVELLLEKGAIEQS